MVNFGFSLTIKGRRFKLKVAKIRSELSTIYQSRVTDPEQMITLFSLELHVGDKY